MATHVAKKMKMEHELMEPITHVDAVTQIEGANVSNDDDDDDESDDAIGTSVIAQFQSEDVSTS